MDPDHDRDLTEELTDPDRIRSRECSSNLASNYLRLGTRLNESESGARVNQELRNRACNEDQPANYGLLRPEQKT